VFLTAIVPECGDLPNPLHGKVYFENDQSAVSPFDIGTIALYVCDIGYGLLEAPGERECLSSGIIPNGTWTGEDYECRGDWNVIIAGIC